MSLTDVACKNAKARSKLYKLSDSGGLCLRVTTSGGKYWVLQYRFGGKQKDLSIGPYPTVSLVKARAARDAAKAALREGADPAIAKIVKRVDAGAGQDNNFKAVAEAWLGNKSSRLTPLYQKRIRDRLDADIFPSLGKLPIQSITTPHLVKCLKEVQKRGAIETAHRLKQYCSGIFRYAIACGIAERDPAAIMQDALITPKSKNFAAISASELPGLLAKLADPEVKMGLQTRLAMQFLMLTFVRTGEMIGAKWSEIDLQKKVWTIPAARMKMRRDHLVPLARQSCDILNILHKLSSGEYVFPKRNNAELPMSNMAVLKGLREMQYNGRMTGHGFRALAATTLHETLEYPFEIIDMQLAHESKKSKVRKAYDRTEFIKQRTEMMQSWADYIDHVQPNRKS